jgi:hypothetical protein
MNKMAYGWPCDPNTEVSQYFGANPNTVQPDGHTGMDFALAIGSPLYAIADGTVLVSDWADNVLGPNNAYGLAVTSWLGRSTGIVVVIDHGDIVTIYGHCNEAPLNAGDRVRRGQLVARSGDTGYTFGAHLHFEIMPKPVKWAGLRWYGRVNPLNYISKEAAPAKPVTATHQRSVGSGGVKYRKAANTSAEIIQIFNPGDVLDFKGYVTNGQNVEGNSTWFVGAHTGGYAWSGAFDNSSTAGLANLTPAAPAPKPVVPAAPTLTSLQRKTGPAGAKYRPEPNTSKPETQLFAEGDVLNFVGWVRGEKVEDNDIWLKGIGGGYVWSGGVIPANAAGLPDLNPKTPAPVVTPKPTTPTPTPVTPTPVTPVPKPVDTFKGDLPCVTEWIPAGEGNFQVGNFPAEPTHLVPHDYGTAGLDTYESTVAWFAKGNREKPSSAHFVVSGYDPKNLHITQMVKLTDRAYGAGPNGNNFIQVEFDPRMHTPEDGGRTIALGRTLIKQLEEKYGYKLILIEHNQIMATSCGDDVNLDDFANLGSVIGTPAPVTSPSGKDAILKALEAVIAAVKKL